MKKYFGMFFTMFRIGLFTFGGGYAMLALLESELVAKKKWMSAEEFMDMVAIAESTPGPIAINSATFIGYKRGGVLGSALCTLGVVLPSFIIIFAISLFFDRFLQIAWVAAAFDGIRVAVVLLIFSAGLKMLKKLPKTPFNITVAAAVGAATITLSVLDIGFSSIFYILIAAAVGLTIYLIGYIRAREKERKK